MQQITVRLADDMLSELEAEADEHGTSRSEYIRDVLESRTSHGEYDASHDELQRLRDEIEDLERENDRLQRERRQILDQRDEHTELVAAVQEERTLEQRRASAPVTERLKWWFTGIPDGED